MVTLCVLVLSAAFVLAHHDDPLKPAAQALRHGFWWWTDQGRYLVAAQAWAHLDINPARHWYLPGYAILGALFVPSGLADPFSPADLACLDLAVLTLAGLAGRVSPRPWAPSLGALALALPFLLSPVYREAWTRPWSTTPTVPLLFGCLLMASFCQDRPTPRRAFATAFLATLVAWFRPTDMLVVLAAILPFMAGACLRPPFAWRSAARSAAAGAAGACLPIIGLIGLHLLIEGPRWGPYLDQSRGTGFELGLLPLRWVMIVLSPRPLFPWGSGLAEAFPWIIPAFGALVAGTLGLLAGRARRHALLASFVAAYFILYLCYRDLHPQGLWRFNNYHYFTAVLPLLGLYTALLAVELAASRRRLTVAATAAATTAALFSWQIVWRPDAVPNQQPVVTGPHTLVIPHGLARLDQAILVATRAPFDPIYDGVNALLARGRRLAENGDFKAVDVPGGMLVEPLRRLRSGPETLVTDPALSMLSQPPPAAGRESVVFGRPCWWSPVRCGRAATLIDAGRRADNRSFARLLRHPDPGPHDP